MRRGTSRFPVSDCKGAVQASRTILGLRNIGQFCLDDRPSLSHRDNDETEPMITGQTTDHGFPPKLPIEKRLDGPSIQLNKSTRQQGSGPVGEIIS
jgi:hypothetical protein